jgi:hypothetical protein
VSLPPGHLHYVSRRLRLPELSGLEDEGEGDPDDRERLGKGEAQDRDGLQATLRLGLTGDAADVGGEDQSDAEPGPIAARP